MSNKIVAEFEEYGVSEDVLAELHNKWQSKVLSSHVADFESLDRPSTTSHPQHPPYPPHPIHAHPPHPIHQAHYQAHNPYATPHPVQVPPPPPGPQIKAEPVDSRFILSGQMQPHYGMPPLAGPQIPTARAPNGMAYPGHPPNMGSRPQSNAPAPPAPTARYPPSQQRIPQVDGPSSSSSDSPSPPPSQGYAPRSTHPSLPQPVQHAAASVDDEEAINSELDDSDSDNDGDREEFQSLRVLDIRKLKLEDQDSFPTSAASQTCLSSVVEVLLPTCPAVLRFAGWLSLPRLRSVVLDAANVRRSATSSVISAIDMFLAAHGAKITTLELLPMTSLSYKPSPISITRLLQPDVCPALDTFVFDCREKIVSAASSPYSSPMRKPAYTPSLLAAAVPPSLLRFLDGAAAPVLSEPHRTLRRIGIRGMGISRLYPSRPTHAQLHLHAFLAHRALFPALETVRTVGLLVDASTDPYARDIFIWWTEKYEERGLDLQDGEGVVWVYTDPVEGKEAAAEEQLDSFGPTILVHKSDRRELRAAKGSV
ncbi:predicted protein [Postia placenta Mad-698-R]|nr:predicted protein [Postia placenta Mad-698-R]